jgi:hypothetical protein
MDWWLVILIVAVALLSRPIESRLWRTGLLSDRKLTLLLVGRFPLLVGLVGLLAGASLPVVLLAVAISLLSGLFLYRFALGLVQERSATDRA